MSATETLNTWAEAWAAFMWGGLIDATVLLALVTLLWLFLRRWLSPQVGYCLFLLILLKLLVPVRVPAPGWLAYFSPRHALEQLPTWASAGAPAPAAPGAAAPGFRPESLRRMEAKGRARERPDPLAGPSPAAATSEAPGPLPAAASGPPLSLQAQLMLGWALVVGALVLRFGWVQWRTQRLVAGAVPVDPAGLPVDLDGLRRRAGVWQPVGFVVSPAVAAPGVWGILRPRVLVPPDLLPHLTANQMTWVLLHELAHVRRADLVVTLVQRLLQIVYFFHPAVWLANWVIDHEREYACDDAALAACTCSRHDCGAGFLCVVERANTLSPTLTPALGLFSGLFDYKAFVRSRLMRIIDQQRPVRKGLSAGAAVFLVAVAAVVLPHLQAEQENQDPQPGAPEVTATPQPAAATLVAQAVQASRTNANPPAPPAAARGREPVIHELEVPPEVTRLEFVFSPDGKKVVYPTDWNYRALVVFELASNTTVPLVQEPPGASVYNAIWSPQGDQVAFTHWTKKERSIRVIPASGGKARVLFASSELELSAQDWSKDGKWILAVAERKDQTRSFMLVPVAGGEPQQLLSFDWKDGYLSGTFSPNGQLVAYNRAKEGQEGIFLFVLASRREIPVAPGTLGSAPRTWSHDGRYLLFRRTRGEARDLWAQRIRDQAPAGAPFLVKQDWPRSGPIQVLDDGRLLYATEDHVPTHLYTAAIDPETGQLRGQPTVLVEDIRLERPILSPDRQWLVGLSPDAELWVRKVDGTEARKLATMIRYPSEYVWYPDGKSVLTAGYLGEGQGKSGLFRIEVTTGKTETLFAADASSIIGGRLSPDGQQIAIGMWARDGSPSLYVMKAEPNAKPTLLCGNLHRSFAWSPDSKSLVFDQPQPAFDQHESERLLVIPATGSEPKELVGPTRTWLRVQAWSPNGKFIAYSRSLDLHPDTRDEIWLVPAAGGPPVHLRELDGYWRQVESDFWSADGKTVFFTSRTGPPKRHLWTMTNYLPAE
jgi:Tol biopolymer transport system component/beta-lactamase regulating signal transducer with metallopeptidase domain